MHVQVYEFAPAPADVCNKRPNLEMRNSLQVGKTHIVKFYIATECDFKHLFVYFSSLIP